MVEVNKSNNKNKGYIDVTEEWLANAKPNSHKVKDKNYYQYNNKIYKINKNNKNIIIDYSYNELMIAYWIERTFGGEIYINPRVNYPKNISTADYLWNNELWDLKELKKSSSLKRAVDNAIKNCEKQCNNFILDLTDCKLNNKEIIKQVKNIFNPTSKLYRQWVNKIIIKRNNDVICIFIKKSSPEPNGQG